MRSERERLKIRASVLIISVSAWLLLLFPFANYSQQTAFSNLCGNGIVSLKLLLKLYGPLPLLWEWAIMLIAMMTPTLIPPLYHVQERSFKSRQVLHITLFLCGYLSIWVFSGIIILTCAVLGNQYFGQGIMLSLTALAAALWQCTPIKQISLNRSHNHQALKAYGWGATGSVFMFGLKHGIWCVVSCGLLMMLPFFITTGHLATMAILSIFMVSERLELPSKPVWRLRGYQKLLRLSKAAILTPQSYLDKFQHK